MKQKFETSESIRIGVVLAISGGFMDAYSYTGRGGVFANAETGNIVLLAISIGNKNLQGDLPLFSANYVVCCRGYDFAACQDKAQEQTH